MVLMCSNEKIDNLPFRAPSGKVQKAEAVVQVDGVLVVRLASGRIMTSARDFHKWAYTISHPLTLRQPVIRGLQAIGFITKQEADEHMAEHAVAAERRERKHAAEMLLIYSKKAGIELTDEQSAMLAARKAGEA